MKPSIAISLIVTGGVLAIAPLISHHIAQVSYLENATKILVQSDNDRPGTFKLSDLENRRLPMNVYSYLCLAAGLGMVGIGIKGAIGSDRTP